MKRRALGRSGLHVSVLGLGCWPLGGGQGWGDAGEEESIATIHAALDQGVNLLDTAEAYNSGRSEEIVGKALVDRRDKAFIATKVSPGNTEPAALRAHCEASLRRLQTDYIDLYQVHWPIREHSQDDAFATLRELKDEGKIRAIGVSNHGVRDLTEALATGTSIVSNQLCYNLLSRAIETGIMPFCREHDVGVITYMPLLQGPLAGIYRSPDDVPAFRSRTRHFSSQRPQSRHHGEGVEAEVFETLARIREIASGHGLPMAQVALAWVAAKPGVASVLVGGRKVGQFVSNLAAASVKLGAGVMAELDEATEALREKLGPNADYWRDGAESRTR